MDEEGEPLPPLEGAEGAEPAEQPDPAGPIEPVDVPAPPEWGRCCCRCAEFLDSPDHYFCCYWKVSPCMPVFIAILLIYCYTMFIVCHFLHFTSSVVRLVSLVESTLVCFLFACSYYSAMCSDPGFLPFNWHDTRRTKYTWLELMAGTGIFEPHIAYVNAVPRPPGCSFSKSYGRYVIRADHICGWITNWVGKRNHKQFLLMTFWRSLTAISLFVWMFFPMDEFEWWSTLGILDMFGAVIELVFGFILVLAFRGFCSEALTTQTRVQRFKGEDRGDVTTTQGMKQICGDGTVACWICPISAFGDDTELDEGQDGNKVRD
jgi:hypothetical protein